MNIQIGGKPHVDGQIDNPEFYYRAMDIIDKFHADHEKAMLEKRMEEERVNKVDKQETNIWVYVVAVIIVCLLFLR